MRWLSGIAPLILLLALGACAETAARGIADATYLHQAAGDYVREVHGFRRFIREKCRESLVREIDTLRGVGDEAALRKMLAGHYPRLVTIDILVAAAEKDGKNILSKAPGCE